MQRAQLETALTAAATVAGVNEFILVGSQSVHAHTDAAPVEVLVSRECDIWAKARFEKLTIVEDALGRKSSFAEQNGFYVDAIQPDIVLLPKDWESRLKPLRVGAVIAWCLDVNDLVVSKLNAGRLKDYEFINAILRLKLAQFDEVVRLVQTLPDPHQQAVLLARLRISSETMP
jgi:hypothetical protein